MSSPVPRRERLRQATLDEIKQTARAQLAERGPAALSLRGVARVMGMAPSALYRYVDSREILLAELVADGFASLAEALEAAFDAADPHDHLRRWLQVARAQRRWALDHPTEYGLIFGPGIPCATSTNDRMITQLHRAVAVLFRCMSESTGAGMIDTAAVDAQLTPPMRASLQAWGRDHDVAIDAAGLAVCLAVWTQLHGFISLEMFGHLPPALDDIDELFDRQMADAIIRVWRGGYNLATVMPVPPAGRPVAK